MSSSCRALFVLPYFAQNGAVDFVVDLADELDARGQAVEILVLNGPVRETRQAKDSVTVTAVYQEAPGRLASFAPVRWYCKIATLIRSVLRSDIVFLTWEMGPALVLPTLAALVLRKPSVAMVQNNVQHSLPDYHGMAGLPVLRWAYARARAVVCVSEDLVAVVAEIGVSEDKLVAIPNAINIERVRQLAKQPPPPIVAEDDTPFVVGVGRLVAQKGFDLLIRAHAAVLDLGVSHRLVLIGHGPDRPRLEALASEIGVSDTVSFLGYIENPFPVVVRSAVFCSSARYEGRSLVLTEAALLGVPMIATDCPTGPREVLADGRYGELVEPDSVPALSVAIEKHLRDPQRLIAKARAATKDTARYSVKTSAQRYIKLMHQVLE